MRRDHLPPPIPPSSLITHALHVQTHTRVCACAQLPGNNADLLVESSTQALTLRQGEEEMNISRRDEEDTGSWSSRVTADTQPTVALPACHLSAVFQPLLHTHTPLPAATKSVLCYRVPTQFCQIRAEVNLIRCNGRQQAHTHTHTHIQRPACNRTDDFPCTKM